MLKKTKQFLICAIIAMGATACGSDDNASGGNPSSFSGDFTVSISVSEGAGLEQANVLISDGSQIENDMNQDLDGQTTWTKTYTKTAQQQVIVSAQGFGKDNSSTMSVKVMRGNNVIKESSASGLILIGQVSF